MQSVQLLVIAGSMAKHRELDIYIIGLLFCTHSSHVIYYDYLYVQLYA